MKSLVSAVGVIFLFLVVAIPSHAHHAFATFFHMNQTVEIEGTVKSFKMVNPHGQMIVEVTEANGSKSLWNITPKPGGQAGLKTGMWVGTKVKVEGNPARKEGAKAMAGERITLADGTVVRLGGRGNVPN